MAGDKAAKGKTSLEFCILDIDYYLETERQAVVRLWGRTRDGKTVLALDRGFLPYFYIVPRQEMERGYLEGEMKKRIGALAVEGKRPVKVELIDKKIYGKPARVFRVKLENPTDVPKFRDLVKDWREVEEEYEYTIPFHRRYLIDRGLIPMAWASVDGRVVERGEMADLCLELEDIKPIEEERYPDFRIMAFDLETVREAGEEAIVMLSMKDNKGFERVLTYRKAGGRGVKIVKDERALLEEFLKTVRERDPDALVTFNGDRFDFLRLDERAEKHKVELMLGRDKRHVVFRRRGRISSAQMNGRVHVDLYDFIENILSEAMSSEILTLDSVAREILGRGKKEMDMKAIERSWRGKDIRELARYCMQDSELTLSLSKRLLPQIFGLCRVSGQKLFDTSRMSYSQLVEWLLIREAFKTGEIIPNTPKFDEIKKRRMSKPYVGGYVYPPEQGIHDNIALFDFASLYPSITITHNISPESIPPEELVLVRENGIIKFTPVGPLVNKLFKRFEKYLIKKGNSEILKNIDNLNVFSFDSNLKIGESRPRAIIRNNTPREIYRICLWGGREVSVTSDHNLFSLRNGELKHIKTRNLRENDFIAIPKRIKTKTSKQLNLLDIILKNCSERKLSMYHLHLNELPMLLKPFKEKFTEWLRKNGYNRRFNDAEKGWLGYFSSIPLKALNELRIKVPYRMLKKARITVGGSRLKTGFPVFLKLNYEFGFVLGSLISEGVLSEKTIFFTNNDSGFHKKFAGCFEKAFGIKLKDPVPNRSDNCSITFCGSYGISTLFKTLGIKLAHTKDKEIPTFLFISPKSCVQGFIDAYLRGDGSVNDRDFRFSTTSKKIPLGLVFLLYRLGIQSSIEKSKRGEFTIYIRGESYARLAKLLKIPVSEKTYKDILPVRDMLIKSLNIVFSKEKFKNPNVLRSIFYNIKNKRVNPTKQFIRQLLPTLDKAMRNKLKFLLNSGLDWARIKSIKRLEIANRTYDFAVNPKENFIGGYGFVCLHNTLECQCCSGKPIGAKVEKGEDALSAERNRVPGEPYYFCLRHKGFIPAIIERLVGLRREANDKLRETSPKSPRYKDLYNRQYALKILANASYGYYGYPGSRWYSKVCAQSITAWGRFYIQKAIAFAKDRGYRVIYGDTDSLFIRVKNEGDARKFQKEVRAGLPKTMRLEFKGLYKSGIFVPAKTGAAAKKRYALIDHEGNMTIRGFEKVRRDWANIAKRTQEEVLFHILRDRSPEKALERVRSNIKRIEGGRVDFDDLVIYTQLTRPLEEYEQIGPHVAAARKAMAQGIPVMEGSVIAYIITKGTGSISDRATPLELARNYDPDYYIHNQVLPAALRVLAGLGYTEDDVLKKRPQASLDSFIGRGLKHRLRAGIKKLGKKGK